MYHLRMPQWGDSTMPIREDASDVSGGVDEASGPGQAADDTVGELAGGELDAADGEGERSARLAARVRAFGAGLVPHLGPLVVYAVIAAYVTHHLLLHPYSRVITQDTSDQTTFEWMLTTLAHQVIHLHNPLFSAAMNAPHGVNLMANPSVPFYGVLLTPLTLAAGAEVSFVVLLAGNLFGTAAAWYWFFLRHPAPAPAAAASAQGSDAIKPGAGRLAAAFGGLMCGFSPAMITHSTGHPNLTGQWLIPLIVDRVFRLRIPGRSVRNGVTLGLLVVAQILIAEELVLIAGLAVAILILLHVLSHHRQAAREWLVFVRGGAVAVGVAATLLAYPLWFQFKGPMSYSGFLWPVANFGANAKSYLLFSQWTLGGDLKASQLLAPNVTEESAFVGWPLLLVAALIVIRRISDSAVRNAALTALSIAVLSLGETPDFGKTSLLHGHRGPWTYLEHLPFFADALPVRLAFAVFPLLAFILVVGLSRKLSRSRNVAIVSAGCAALAFAPVFPATINSIARPTAPAFYADGLWRQCAGPGRSIIAFPFSFTSMRWATVADTEFPLVGGNFFGPGANGRVIGQPPMRATGDLLNAVDSTGTVPVVTAQMRAQARSDATYWKADCVALYSAVSANAVSDGADLPLLHPVQDRELLTALYGPGRVIGGVWTGRLSEQMSK